MLDRKKPKQIIFQLPVSDRILIEAGTPFIKRYGITGIRQIKLWYSQRLFRKGSLFNEAAVIQNRELRHGFLSKRETEFLFEPYLVADLKCMDRGETEVEIAAEAGANGAIALGSAPLETLNAFVEKCKQLEMDAMIDMMNINFPLKILRDLKQLPQVVILHRGVDEEHFNKEKQIPFHEISRIKSNYDIMISIAGGDAFSEVQRAVFNDADIVVVWKSFYKSSSQTAKLAEEFLKEIK